MNSQESMNVLFLRRYKTYFRTDVEAGRGRSKIPRIAFAPQTVRAYFDYAPYGELYDLMDKYTGFDKHFPEAFVWHVFHSLARAVRVMNAGPWTRIIIDSRSRLKTVKLKKEVFLNHFDMKPGNVFLGYNATEESPTTATDANEWNPERDYLKVLLADFGLADLLTEDNKNQDDIGEPSYADKLIQRGNTDRPNPRDYWSNTAATFIGPTSSPENPWNGSGWGFGTPQCYPPEQLRWGANWTQPPNGRIVTMAEAKDLGVDDRPTYDAAQKIVHDDKDAKGYRFTRASNIWALGKIIYDVAYLTSSHEYQDEFRELPQDATWQEQRYTEVDGNMVDRRVTNPDCSQELQT